VDEKEGTVHGLSLAAFYFLFSGGALVSVANEGLDIDEGRLWREKIPLVGLFGGAMGNQIMQGKAKIGKAIPICKETEHLIPERFLTGNVTSIWDLLQEEAYTRRDDEKNEELRKLISPDVRYLLEASARAKREKRGTKDDIAGDTGTKQQMRYYVETFSAGTRFYWDIVLEDVNDIEFEAFCITLAEFGKYPYLGGKSGVGHGKVSIRFDKWVEINPRMSPVGQEIDFPLGSKYIQHLMENRDVIRNLLDSIK